jgi:hypothetical protein
MDLPDDIHAFNCSTIIPELSPETFFPKMVAGRYTLVICHATKKASSSLSLETASY